MLRATAAIPFISCLFYLGSVKREEKLAYRYGPLPKFVWGKKNTGIAIPRSWYRAQNPSSPEIRKKIRKKSEKLRNPPPRVGPRKYEKNTEKIQKRVILGHVCTFSVFFSYFRGPTRGGDSVIFSYFFRISGLEGFLSSIPGTRNRNTGTNDLANFPGRAYGPRVLNLFQKMPSQWYRYEDGGHLKPVTLKPCNHPHFPHFPRFRVRIFRIFRVFRVFALRNLLRPLLFWGERDCPHFPHFSRIGFESLISKIRPTGSLRAQRLKKINLD